MCTRSQADWCSELDRDRSAWSTVAPLDPPDWVRAAFGPLVRAMVLADQGGVRQSVDIYRRDVPDRQLNEWFDVHAQYTYKWRCTAQGIPAPAKLAKADRAPMLGPADGALSRQVYARDSYRCRYCGIQLVAIPAMRRFRDRVGQDVFPIGTTNRNKESAGAAFVFRPVADHVEPWSRGGATDPDNLVTACWPCNFGKMEYTVDELGITDPRDREPVRDGWDGLRAPRGS